MPPRPGAWMIIGPGNRRAPVELSRQPVDLPHDRGHVIGGDAVEVQMQLAGTREVARGASWEEADRQRPGPDDIRCAARPDGSRERAKERRAEAAQADKDRLRDLDETRRLAYAALVA